VHRTGADLHLDRVRGRLFTELLLAPSKPRYARHHWLTAVSVLLPAFRVVKILRVAADLHGMSLVRLVTIANRGGRALEHVVRRGQLGYVLGLSVLITLAGAAGWALL
jgi:voltage-gated potassium channel